jgi:hypothetical protein
MLAAQKRAPAAPPPAPLPRQEPAPPVVTQPGAEIPLSGALTLFLVLLLVAPLLGGVVALVSYHFMYLIILFPICMGWAGGYALAQGVRWGKVRDAVIAATFGVLLGLSIYVCYRYVEYRLLRNEVRAEFVKEMEAEFGVSDAAIADEFFDEILLEETGKSGFLGVILLDAQEGMSIAPARYSSDSAGLNIGTPLTWVYWLFEIVAIAGIAAFMAHDAAQQPFCARHDRWYAKEKSLGGVGPGRVQHALDLLEQGDHASFSRELKQNAPVPGIEFFIERCVGCVDSNPVLTVKGVKRSSRGQVSYEVLSKQHISPSQCELLLGSKELGK